MLIASMSIGDSLVTLVAVQALNRDTVPRITYNLTFTDIPTDKRYTKSFVGEANALYAIAAWIMADDVEAIHEALKGLRDDPGMKGQLP